VKTTKEISVDRCFPSKFKYSPTLGAKGTLGTKPHLSKTLYPIHAKVSWQHHA